jgi:hypothetical protein
MKERLAMGLVTPDLWQQEAVRALQQGKDVVVQAPTGSHKTYIFELVYPNLKTHAVFTVPHPRGNNGQRYRAKLEHGLSPRDPLKR